MARRRAEDDDDDGPSLADLNELAGKGILDTDGTPPVRGTEPVGEGLERGDADPGTPDVDSDDDQDDGEGDHTLKAERRAKKKALQTVKRLTKENTDTRMRVRALEDQLNALVHLELEKRSGSYDQAVATAESKLQAAIDEGDSKAQIAAQRELTQAERAREYADDAVRRAREQQPAPPEPTVEEPAVNDLAESWMESHPWFRLDKPNDADCQFVIKTSDYVERVMGLPPDDPEHFEALDRLIARDLPHRAPKGSRKGRDMDAADLAPTAGSSRPGSNGAARGSAREPAHLRNISLTPIEIRAYELMPDAGLDWSNPEHKTRMKQLKYETVTADRNRRRA